MTRRFFRPALLLLAAAGCGPSGPPLAAVSGRVTLDGKPLAFKTVRFVPEAGVPGQGAGATTAADGGFALIAVRPGAVTDTPGTPPGAYRVVVTEPMFPIDAPPAADGDAPAPAIGAPGTGPRKRPAVAVPARYANPDSTPLRATVAEGGSTVDLELTTR